MFRALNSFRAQMKQALHAAEQDALARGYKIDDIRRVIFAVVAFLDESVLGAADIPPLPIGPVFRCKPSCTATNWPVRRSSRNCKRC